MGEITVRGFEPADADTYVRLRRAADPVMPEEMVRSHLTNPMWHAYARCVAALDGVLCGYASLARFDEDPDLIAYVVVDEPVRGRGVGHALFACLVEAPDGASRPWVVDIPDGHGADVARTWGFQEFSRSVFSRLVLPQPSPEPASGAVVEILDSDQIVRAGRTAEVDDAIRRSSTHPEAVSLGWIETVATGSAYPGAVWSLASRGQELVGVAYAFPTRGGEWMLSFTGVVPEARGHGVARDLKAALHTAAAEQGATSVLTANEVGNDAIRALNLSLGYRPVAERVRLRRPAAG